MSLISKISFIAAIVLPFWNLPLIMRVIKRKSSEDISLWWALGVWICFVLMLPEGLSTEEAVFKAFTISNFILFTITTFVIVIYHRGAFKG